MRHISSISGDLCLSFYTVPFLTVKSCNLDFKDDHQQGLVVQLDIRYENRRFSYRCNCHTVNYTPQLSNYIMDKCILLYGIK